MSAAELSAAVSGPSAAADAVPGSRDETTTLVSRTLPQTLSYAQPQGAASQPPPGILRGARVYRVGALLGEGGSGSVYQAARLDNGQLVAIKLLREDAVQPTEQRQRLRARFERETQLCERLHHPHVVALLDKGETPGGQLFAVFEFVPGRTLRDLLAADAALSAVTTGILMTQVLDGLAGAHRQGVVHRDLKPQNVMITMTGGAPQAKILDFGIGALLPDAQRGDERTLTRSHEVLGSPQYCSPEQLRNEELTLRSDLYAWGLVVIECLTGHAVMQGSSVADILYQQLSPVDVALPPAIAAHPLGTVLRRALNKDPRQRAGSAEELAAQFRTINFPALVGEFGYRHVRRSTPAPAGVIADPERAISADTSGAAGERRQVTALCCSVTIADDGRHAAGNGRVHDALEAFQAQWLTRCSDIAIRYGGQTGGTLGDTLLFYFGYPERIDKAARRAARAALDMVRSAGDMRGEASADAARNGWRAEIAAAIHVGALYVQPSAAPGGATPNAAVRLQRLAPPGRVLLSDDARRSLERYVDYTPTPLQFADAGSMPRPVYALLGERQEQAQFDSLDQGATVPMTGRDRERAALIRGWQAVIQGHSGGRRLAEKLVIGEAGIGKSRLVHELCEAVRAQRHAFAYCVCLPEQINHALFPILRFVRMHWQIEADGPAHEALAAVEKMIAPLDCDHGATRATLAAWLGLAGETGETGELRWSGKRQQQALFDVLQQLLASLGGGAPVLLVLEDVQWIDSATADFLHSLPRRSGGAPIYVVLTSRPVALERWQARARRLALRRLSRTDTRSLIVALLAQADVDPASLDFLEQRTAGIPLFVEEIIRELVVSGAVTEPGRPLSALVMSEHYPLPGSLRDMLELAFDRIDGARDTAQLAATIGLEVDAQLIADASPHGAAVLEEHLRRLLEARVVYARHRLGGISYVFRHALIRDAAYESMPAAIRHRNHERVGRALGARPGGDATAHPTRIAHHFALAGAFAQAVPHGIEAARGALARALHDDAIRLAETVREWLAQCSYAGQDEDAARIDLTLTHALMARFGWANPQVRDHAERLLEQLNARADSPGITPLAASVLWTLATYYHVASDRAAVRRIVAQLGGVAAGSGDASIGVAVDAMRGMSLWIDGRLIEARGALDAALAGYDVARDAGHRRVFGLDTRAWSMAALASLMWSMDDADGAALDMALEAVYCATCTDHLPTLGVTLMYLARMQQCAGDRDGARTTSAVILRLSQSYGLSAVERYAAIIHAWSAGDRAAVAAHIDALRQSGCLLGLTYYASLLAEIDGARGDWASAIVEIDRCLALCDSLDERYYEAELLLRKAQFLYEAGAGAAAASVSCRRALAMAEERAMGRVVRKARNELSRWQ
jgi:TOMM system kinase/cyclase fusion protein